MSNPPVRDVIKANNKYKQAYLDMFALIFVWNTTLDIKKHVQNYSHVKDEIKQTIDILNEAENTNPDYQLGAPFPNDETFMGELKTKVGELYSLKFFYWHNWENSLYTTENLNLDKIGRVTALFHLKFQILSDQNNIDPYIELAKYMIETGKADLTYVDPVYNKTYLDWFKGKTNKLLNIFRFKRHIDTRLTRLNEFIEFVEDKTKTEQESKRENDASTSGGKKHRSRKTHKKHYRKRNTRKSSYSKKHTRSRYNKRNQRKRNTSRKRKHRK